MRTYCGHGVNDLFHTAPNVPHYAKNKAVGTMKPGMTFTIEPVRFLLPFIHIIRSLTSDAQMINLGPHWDVVHWPDDWTATTVDGKRSAQFEETLL